MKCKLDEKKLKTIIRYLKRIGCSKIWLIGSFAEKGKMTKSDIDIVVSGLPPYLVYKAIAQLPLLVQHSIDLINFDELPENFKKDIEDSGLLLYAEKMHQRN